MISDILFRIISALIGYFCGIFVSGYFVGKKNDVDIRTKGSGNVGTTNALRTLGPRAGGITLVLDAIKPALAMLIVWLVFKLGFGFEDIRVLMMYACVGTILGHDFPFYLHFKGGKGIACSVSMVLFMFPQVFPWACVIFLVIVIFTKYVSLGSMIGSISYFVGVVILVYMGNLNNINPQNYLEICILTGFLSALAVFQHRANIGRLIRHEENKLVLKHKRPDGTEEEQ